MEDNRNSTDLNAMVLHFEKRRFDGGSEIELIQYIESTNNLANALAVKTATPPALQAASVPRALPASTPRSKRSKLVLEALLLGPMEVAVGSVGILTSSLAVMTFSRMNNPEMTAQSKAVLRECVLTLIKGIINTLFSPIKALKVAVVGT